MASPLLVLCASLALVCVVQGFRVDHSVFDKKFASSFRDTPKTFRYSDFFRLRGKRDTEKKWVIPDFNYLIRDGQVKRTIGDKWHLLRMTQKKPKSKKQNQRPARFDPNTLKVLLQLKDLARNGFFA